MSGDIRDALETSGDAPVTPQWRARLLTVMPVRFEPGEEGPKRLARHERVPDEGHRRGR